MSTSQSNRESSCPQATRRLLTRHTPAALYIDTTYSAFANLSRTSYTKYTEKQKQTSIFSICTNTRPKTASEARLFFDEAKRKKKRSVGKSTPPSPRPLPCILCRFSTVAQQHHIIRNEHRKQRTLFPAFVGGQAMNSGVPRPRPPYCSYLSYLSPS